VNFDDWDFVMDVNSNGGNGDGWTLTDGQAFVMEPHQQIMIQSHFLNGTTVQTPKAGGAILNLYETDPAHITHPLYGMFTVNTKINILPHSTYTTSRQCTFNTAVHVVAMTGHFHARGRRFTVDRTDPALHSIHPPTVGEQIYESDNYDDPPFTLFEDNPQFFIETQGVQFTCSYQNDTDMTIGWGGHADVQEHCNLFFQYYEDDPSKHIPLNCLEGSSGW
jgi:hypothetical protein